MLPSPRRSDGRRTAATRELMAFTVRLQAHLDRGTPERCTDEIHEVLAMLGPSGMPAMYYAGPARVLLAAGETGHARAVLRAFLSGTPAAMPRDAEWLECHWAMGDIAVALDDRAAAAGLFAALRPYEDLWAVDGIGGAVFGTVDRAAGQAGGPPRPSRRRRLPPGGPGAVRPAGPPRAGRAGRRDPDRTRRGRCDRADLRTAAPRRPRLAARMARAAQHGARLEGPARPRGPARPARARGAGARPRRGRGRPARRRRGGRPRTGPRRHRRGRRTGAGSASWTARSRRRSPTPTSAAAAPAAPSGRCSPTSSPGRSAWAGAPASPATRPNAPARP